MPKPLKYPTKLLIGFDDEQLAAVDDWRRRQPDLPTRSEAIRRLVAEAVEKRPGLSKAKRRARKPSEARQKPRGP